MFPRRKNKKKSCIDNYLKKQFSKTKRPFREQKKIPQKSKDHKKPIKTQTAVKCYRCGRIGHIAKYCKITRKINELSLDQEIQDQINLILSISSESEEKFYPSSHKEEGLQINELSDTSSDNEKPEINMLTRDQEFLLSIADQITDPEAKKITS